MIPDPPTPDMTCKEAREYACATKQEPPVTRIPFWGELLQGGRGSPLTGPRKRFEHVDLQDVRSLGIRIIYPSIRSSGIGTYRQCPRKYLYRYRMRLRPRTYSPALRLGQAYHRIIAALYEGQSVAVALSRVADHLSAIEEDLKHLASESGILPNGKTIDKQLSDCQADLQKAKAMALWEWQNFPLDTETWEVWGVEKSLEIRYLTLAQPVRMRLDLVLRKKGTKELWIVDHKTTSVSPLQRLDTVMYEIQPRIYRLGLEAYISQDNPDDLFVAGIIHHIIRKPTIRQTQKESWTDYLERIPKWYSEKHSESDPMYVRSWVRFSGPVMSEELLLQLREASRASRAHADPARFYRDPTGHACFEYNRACEYLELCRTAIVDWPNMITNSYEVISRDDEDGDE